MNDLERIGLALEQIANVMETFKRWGKIALFVVLGYFVVLPFLVLVLSALRAGVGF